MTDTMIERLEKAIADAEHLYISQFPDNRDLLEMSPILYRAQVRAVLEALREPTEAMTRPSDDYTDREHNATLFRQMIDAALSEKQG